MRETIPIARTKTVTKSAAAWASLKVVTHVATGTGAGGLNAIEGIVVLASDAAIRRSG